MRRYSVIFTPRAQRQLDGLYAHIAARSGELRADAYVGRLVAACLALEHFPERGTRRHDVRPDLRTMGYARSATIAFAIDVANSKVVIHGVFYGGQDFEQALDVDDQDS